MTMSRSPSPLSESALAVRKANRQRELDDSKKLASYLGSLIGLKREELSLREHILPTITSSSAYASYSARNTNKFAHLKEMLNKTEADIAHLRLLESLVQAEIKHDMSETNVLSDQLKNLEQQNMPPAKKGFLGLFR